MKNAEITAAVLVLDQANMLSLASAMDPMRAANRMASRDLFAWQFVTTTGAPATLTSGLQVPGIALARLTRCDLLVVVASFDIDRQSTPSLLAGLRRIAATGAMIAGLDGGPWIMARAGLLDRHNATTHWEDLDRFASQFPNVHVHPDRFVIDGNRLTSGGAMPGLDMMLHLISDRFGSALATRVAGAFIHDSHQNPKRAQARAQYQADASHPGHNALTTRASGIMEQSLETPLAIPDIARRCACSVRSLETQFRARLGTTPQAHYLHLRLSEAHRLVVDTDHSLLDIALLTGFTSQSSFARAFRGAFGQTARSLRTPR